MLQIALYNIKQWLGNMKIRVCKKGGDPENTETKSRKAASKQTLPALQHPPGALYSFYPLVAKNQNAVDEYLERIRKEGHYGEGKDEEKGER